MTHDLGPARLPFRLAGAAVLPALGQAGAGGQDFVEGGVFRDLPRVLLRVGMAVG